MSAANPRELYDYRDRRPGYRFTQPGLHRCCRRSSTTWLRLARYRPTTATCSSKRCRCSASAP